MRGRLPVGAIAAACPGDVGATAGDSCRDVRPSTDRAQARDAVKSRSFPPFGGEAEKNCVRVAGKGKSSSRRGAPPGDVARVRAILRARQHDQRRPPRHARVARGSAGRLAGAHDGGDDVRSAGARGRGAAGLRPDHRSEGRGVPGTRGGGVRRVGRARALRRNPMDDDEGEPGASQPRVFGLFREQCRAAWQLDPRKLPVDLLVYVVDTHLTSRGDVGEALRRRGRTWRRRSRACGTSRTPRLTTAARNGRMASSEDSYVLPNILRRGGSVNDAAYFAAESASRRRAGGGLRQHDRTASVAAWAGFLDPAGQALGMRRPRDHAQFPWIGRSGPADVRALQRGGADRARRRCWRRRSAIGSRRWRC